MLGFVKSLALWLATWRGMIDLLLIFEYWNVMIVKTGEILGMHAYHANLLSVFWHGFIAYNCKVCKPEEEEHYM